MSKPKMSDEDIELFVKHNPKAHKRYKAGKRRKAFNETSHKVKSIWKPISNAILWICAVGGFIVSLVALFRN